MYINVHHFRHALLFFIYFFVANSKKTETSTGKAISALNRDIPEKVDDRRAKTDSNAAKHKNQSERLHVHGDRHGLKKLWPAATVGALLALLGRDSMMKEPDELDNALLQRIYETPGMCIREVIRPFLLQRSESVLRARIQALELRQLIKTARTKKEVQCFCV